MRLPNLKEHCGCGNRKFIMFEAGRLGLTEAAILAGSAAVVLVVWRLNK